MLVRDILKATAKAGAVPLDALMSRTQEREILRLRQVGLLISSRLTTTSWTIIGRVWDGRDRGTVEKAALKADTRIARGDPETLAMVKDILALLDVEKLPPARPVVAGPRRSRATIADQLAIAKARVRALTAKLNAMDGDAR